MSVLHARSLAYGRRGVVVLAALAALCGASTASAAETTTGPRWKILAVSNPTNFKPGDQTGADAIVITAVNVGGASAGCTQAQIELEEQEEKDGRKQPQKAGCTPGSLLGGAVTITDQLPAQLKAVEVFGVNAYHDPFGELGGAPPAEWAGPPGGLSCSLSTGAPSCSTSERIDPGDTLVVTIRVDVETAQEGSSEVNQAFVSGGGAASASVSDPVTIGTASPEYGLARGGSLTATSTSQAGGHPNLTNEFFLNTVNPLGEAEGEHCGSGSAFCAVRSESVGSIKDFRFNLPKGLVGTTVGMARCTLAEVLNQANCPRDTMVGMATAIVLNTANGDTRLVITVPVYNITPAPGEPLALAFDALFFPARIDTSLLSDGEYEARATVSDITGGANAYMSSVTIWGDPAEHNGFGPDAAAKNLKGNSYLEEGTPAQVSFGGSGAEEFSEEGIPPIRTVYETRQPLLTNPTQCSTPLTAVLETDSWEAPGGFGGPRSATTPVGTATGCSQLTFNPSFSMVPHEHELQAGEPAGYTLKLKVPQNNEPEGLATPNVEKVVQGLPAGTVLSPSAANDLGDCTNEQFELHSGKPGGCPSDSQIGVVHVKSPDLEEELNGEAYLAAPECDPCTPQQAEGGQMVRLFVQVVGEGEDAVVVKLEGTSQINQQTGQVTTTFANLPQLPFSSFQLILNGGERAALANPRTCGLATSGIDLTPWSTPFTPDATPTSSFEVDEGCFGPQFNPSFVAGTSSNQAGSFSPTTLTFGRSDSDEYLDGLQLTAPPGLLGMISSVTQCPEPQASQGTCPSSSEVGEVTTEVGPGTDPYTITGGKAYLTGPYKGAPYGASIVIPAKAGPFTLAGNTGNGTDVVRAAVTINPETGQFTVTTDPFPTQLDGIPIQIRQVTTTLGAGNNFTFNPTSCEKMTLNGTLVSVGGASANRSSSFQDQDTSCAALKFKPSFTVSTSGTASKVDGASLTVKIATKQGPDTKEGEREANIRKVDVQLPIDLPSRLSTLQLACTEQQFAANPAGCPEGSFVGTAVAHTPILNVALTGPAILVSHANAAFPDLDLILQGEGVVIRLVGNTDIKKGITYSKFEAAPDAPVSSFELTLPKGPHSILGAYVPTGGYSFCSLEKVLTTSKKETRRVKGKTKKVTVNVKTTEPASLEMPTTITAQDGAVLKQDTKIAVTGCPTAKAAKKAAAARRRAAAARARRAAAHTAKGASG
jgi:hypothetical protein